MTIDDVIRVVNDATGKESQPDSRLNALVDDSLEFMNLIVRVSDECGDIPDVLVTRIETVKDLFLAASGQLF
jgi:acyl carrier protein